MEWPSIPPLPLLLLSSLLLLLLPLPTHSSPAVSPSRCEWVGSSSAWLPSTSSSFALSRADSSQSYFVSTSDASLTVHSLQWAIGGSSTPLTDSTFSQLSFPTHPSPSPCLTVLPTPSSPTSLSASPAWGHFVDAQLDRIIVGNPNQLPPSPSTTVSFIDVLTLTASALSGLGQAVWNVSAETIWAFDSPYLGTVASLSPSASALASLYSLDSIAVFSPITARASPTFAPATDALLTVPLTFYIDSLQLMDTALYVTGTTTTTMQQATLLLFTLQGTNAWTMTSTLPLTRVSPASALLNSLTFASSLGSRVLPSRALPLDVSADESLAVIGVPRWGTTFLVDLTDPTFPSPSSLRFLVNDPVASGDADFGLDVSIALTGASTELSLAIAVAARALIIPVSTFIADATQAGLLSTLMPVPAVSLAEVVYPNLRQFDAASAFDRPCESVAISSAVVVVQMARDARALTSLASGEKFLIIPALQPGKEVNLTSESIIDCPPGSFRDTSMINTQPCAFCPVGQYASTAGSTECIDCGGDDGSDAYCPLGSVYPYSQSVVSATYPTFLPYFQAESFAETYEELLINGIFGPKNASMVVLYTCFGLTMVLILLVVVPWPCKRPNRWGADPLGTVAWFIGQLKFPDEQREQHELALEEQIIDVRMMQQREGHHHHHHPQQQHHDEHSGQHPPDHDAHGGNQHRPEHEEHSGSAHPMSPPGSQVATPRLDNTPFLTHRLLSSNSSMHDLSSPTAEYSAQSHPPFPHTHSSAGIPADQPAPHSGQHASLYFLSRSPRQSTPSTSGASRLAPSFSLSGRHPYPGYHWGGARRINFLGALFRHRYFQLLFCNAPCRTFCCAPFRWCGCRCATEEHRPPPSQQQEPDDHRQRALKREQLERWRRSIHQTMKDEAQLEDIIKGFFAVVLLLFVITSVVYSIQFVRNWNYADPNPDHNYNRFSIDQLHSLDVTDAEEGAGIQAINLINATINIYLVGYSGMECVDSGQYQLQVEGCVLQNTDTPCNVSAGGAGQQTVFMRPLLDSPDLPHTCVVTFLLVQGSLLSNTAYLTLVLPPSFHMQALRMEFLQTGGAQNDVFSIGDTTYFDNTLHPYTDDDSSQPLLSNALPRTINTAWVFGILSWSYQVDDATPEPGFYSWWYNTVSSPSDLIFPALTPSAYALSRVQPVRIRHQMVTVTYWRLQQTQKLIQAQAAFLTVLLGLIAIYHLIHFTIELAELIMLYLFRVRTAVQTRHLISQDHHDSEQEKKRREDDAQLQLLMHMQRQQQQATQLSGPPATQRTQSLPVQTSPLPSDRTQPHPAALPHHHHPHQPSTYPQLPASPQFAGHSSAWVPYPLVAVAEPPAGEGKSEE